MIRTILYFTLICVALSRGQSDANFFKFKNLRSGYAPPGETVGKTTVTPATTSATTPLTTASTTASTTPSSTPSTTSSSSLSPASPTTPTATTSAPTPPSDVFVSSGLPIINVYRSLHHADPLSSSPTLSTLATACAKGYKGDGTLANVTDATLPLSASSNVTTPCAKTGGGNELLVFVNAGNPVPLMLSSILAWEKEEYIFAKPVLANLLQAERRTQMLWKATKEVGWGCDDKNIIIIGKDPVPAAAYMLCSVIFKPKGNVLGGIGEAGLKTYIANVKDI